MKKTLIVLLLISGILPGIAQNNQVNYDESKVPSYKLPDPLIFKNGTPVKAKKDWEKRRAEIMNIFQDEVYGRSPEWKGTISSKEITSNQNALGGTAVRKDIKLT